MMRRTSDHERVECMRSPDLRGASSPGDVVCRHYRDAMNLPWPLDDCPDVYTPDPGMGSAGYVSNERSEDGPSLWIPNPEAPSMYVEHPVRPRRRPIGFGR